MGPDRAGPGLTPDGGSGPDRAQPRALWVIGAVFYVVEVAVLALICLTVGGLSAMLADICFSDSTELICEPRWQTITALTPIVALGATVVAMGALVAWRRRLWALVAAMVVTPVVPLVAFLVMQEVVTA